VDHVWGRWEIAICGKLGGGAGGMGFQLSAISYQLSAFS